MDFGNTGLGQKLNSIKELKEDLLEMHENVRLYTKYNIEDLIIHRYKFINIIFMDTSTY